MLSASALNIAVTQIGVEEIPRGSNSGPQVSAYEKSVGLAPGNPWCMAFVYWCVNQAAAALNIVNPLIKTGGVHDQLNRSVLRVLPKTSSAVKPGDIFIMEFSPTTGHTGFVEAVVMGMVHTIEGNSNDDGSREGYEVLRRSRPISSIKAFIQLP
jgi:hypothetical protein